VLVVDPSSLRIWRRLVVVVVIEISAPFLRSIGRVRLEVGFYPTNSCFILAFVLFPTNLAVNVSIG
jgi:hypothetical protein